MSDSVESVLRALLSAAIVIAAAYLGFAILQWVARRYGTRYPAFPALVDQAKRPFRFLVGLAAAQIVATRIAHVHGTWVDYLEHGLQIATIVSLVWLAITAVNVIEQQILRNDGKRDRDTVDRRRFQTQITLLRRLIVASIVGIGVVAVLLTFPAVASLGTTLVASAGLISIVAGLAAQTSLTNVFAGIQLALSDTIRVGDVVVANTQSGTITQLTLTHVEMRLWDGRVLILPSVFFISEPFENWTRNRNRIGGSVLIDVDWDTPIDAVRAEVTRILKNSDLWDGRRNFVLVTGIAGTTLNLQIGISASSTDKLFELQSLVSEKVTEFLVKQHPESLVRNRTQPITQPGPPAQSPTPASPPSDDDEVEDHRHPQPEPS